MSATTTSRRSPGLHQGDGYGRGGPLPQLQAQALRGRLPGQHPHPEFIAKVAEGDFQAAYDIISDTNALPSVSGRVCLRRASVRPVRPGHQGRAVAIGGWSALWPIGTGRMSTPCLRSPDQWHQGGGGGLGPASLTAPAIWPSTATRLPSSRPSTPPAACWCTASRVPPAQGHRAERGGQAHAWAWIGDRYGHRQDLRH